MRQKLIAGNWKMNTDYQEALILVTEINGMLSDELRNPAVKIVIGAPFTHLHSIKQLLTHPQVSIAGQNCHQEAKGAYTGEISAAMLASIGCEYVILGHSERRQYFGENDALIAQKIKAAQEKGLKVIYCCGETLEERENGTYFHVLKEQVQTALSGLDETSFKNIIVAYEPVWAIGTGKTASAEQAQEVHAYLRSLLAAKFGEQAAQYCSILYGGSCNAQNAAVLFEQRDIDGGLIGGASLKSRDFVEIVKAR